MGIHLAGGRWIAQHGRVPKLDPFTWTLSDQPYVAYHWLFQLAAHGVERLAGSHGLAALRALVLFATGLILLDTLRVRRVSPEAGALVGLLAILASEWRFTLRPELGSWLLGAMMLWVLERHRAGLRSPLVLLPAIQLLWANVHVHVLGLALIGIYLLDEVVREKRLATPLLRFGFVSVLATAVNPYFLEGALYPVTLATRLSGENIFGQYIAELVSPFRIAPDPRFPFSQSLQLSAFRALWLGGVLALVWHASRRRVADVGVLLVFGLLAAAAVRNTTLYVLFAAPALAVAFQAGFARLVPTRARGFAAPLVLGAVAVCATVEVVRVIGGSFYTTDARPDQFGGRYCRACLAFEGADWLARADLVGPRLNDHYLGSILMWRDPEHPVFIDGRNEVSGEAFYQRYRRALDPARWEQTRETWGFEQVALIHASAPHNTALAARLARDANWRLVHLDAAVAVFVRADGPNGDRAPAQLPAPVSADERSARVAALDASMATRSSFAERWLVGPGTFPDEYRVGAFLLAIGELAAAEDPLLRAIETSPNHFAPRFDLGVLYQRAERNREAAQAFRWAQALDPNHPSLEPLLAARANVRLRPGTGN